MKVQIRQSVFETNASSTHAISIIKKSNITEYPDEVRFDKGDFGWDFEIYFDTSDKASYLWEAIIGYYWKNIDNVKKCMQVIKEYTKSKGYDIVHVINNLEYGVYTETIENTDTHVKYFSEHGNNKWITVDEFDKFFDDVMKDENIITFQDIAYAPYNKPKIYIL